MQRSSTHTSKEKIVRAAAAVVVKYQKSCDCIASAKRQKKQKKYNRAVFLPPYSFTYTLLHLPFAIQVISILKTHFALSLTHSLAYSLPTIAVCWRVIFGVFKW